MNNYYFLFALFILNISFASCTTYSDALKKKVDIDVDKLTNSLTKECIEEDKNSEYNICIPEITLSNYRKACSDVQSEKCQKFYDDPDKSKYYPNCSKNPLYNEYLQPLVIDYIKVQYLILCSTDENDQLCPAALYEMQPSYFENSLYENCRSKKCNEQLIEMYKNLNLDHYGALESISTSSTKFSYDILSSIKSIKEYVNSSDCKGRYENNVESKSNGSNTFKTNTMLSTILIIILMCLNF